MNQMIQVEILDEAFSASLHAKFLRKDMYSFILLVSQ